jgi:hypothetical protein
VCILYVYDTDAVHITTFTVADLSSVLTLHCFVGPYISCVHVFCFALTGLAIRTDDFDAWERNPKRTAAPSNCMYCPLCLASVEDSDSAWLDHLVKGCPRNVRTNGEGVHVNPNA